MLKVIKINGTLNVRFEYDPDIVSKIKTIPGRKYNPNTKSWDMPLQAIHKLKELFDDLDIAEDVDQDYKTPKYDFQAELESIENETLRVALLLHDGVKHGPDGSAYVVSTHPLEVIKFLEDKYFEVEEEELPQEVIDIMEDDCWYQIAECIKSHMGEWNTDYKTKEEVLPKPKTELQKFTHMCDYLASRKCLEFNFNVGD